MPPLFSDLSEQVPLIARLHVQPPRRFLGRPAQAHRQAAQDASRAGRHGRSLLPDEGQPDHEYAEFLAVELAEDLLLHHTGAINAAVSAGRHDEEQAHLARGLGESLLQFGATFGKLTRRSGLVLCEEQCRDE